MSVPPLLHIGFHKTGTRWLQNKLFGSVAARFWKCGNENDAKRELVRPHDLEFDHKRARAFFERLYDRAPAGELIPVFSAERLCSDMLFGAYDSARLAERLSATFPDGRVLMVIREQRTMLFSNYHQYVRMGGPLRLGRYLRQPKHAHPWPCDLRHFAFDRLIWPYHRLFGADNVLALPYELFQAGLGDLRPPDRRVCRPSPQPGAIDALPFGTIVNRSWPAQTIAAKRHANRVLRGRLNPWAPIGDRSEAGRKLTHVLVEGAQRLPPRSEERTRKAMTERIRTAVGSRYRESNARTSELIGIDLAQYGYDMPDRSQDPVGKKRKVGSAG
jgi:hypothetical protein